MTSGRLMVQGLGSSRESALNHAERQARQFYGPDVPLAVEVGDARAEVMAADGTVIHFAVDVTYEVAHHVRAVSG